MQLLSACISRDYGLVRTITSDVGKLTAALKRGAVAVCNVGGDIKTSTGKMIYEGVFSDGGHYLVAVGSADDTIILVDPGMYDTRYSSEYRATKVNVLSVKDGIIAADKSVLDKDCASRSPRYYIFDKS